MVRAGDEPAEKPAQAQAEDVGDPFVPPERGHLAEHAVTVRARRAGEVLDQAAGLAQGVLARRRVEALGCGRVRHASTIAERPDRIQALHPERGVDEHAPTLVQREPELGEQGVRLDARRPDDGFGLQARSVRQQGGMLLDLLERRRDADVHAAFPELLRGVVAEPLGDLGEDLRRCVHENPALANPLQPWIEPRRVAEEVGELREGLDARVAGADEDEAQMALRVLGRKSGVGELELAQDVVAQVDRIREALEPERVLGEAGDGERAGDGPEGDDEALVPDPRRADLRLDVGRAGVEVERRRSSQDELGVPAHHPERHHDVAGLQRPGCSLREDRRVEHEVLATDDGRAALAEEACDVASCEAAAEDQGPA